MGRRKSAGRVEARENSIRVSFNLNGELVRETLRGADGKPIKPLIANQNAARTLVAEIELRILQGRFVYRDFFPHSSRAEPEPESEEQTFGYMADKWLRSKGQNTPGTKNHYASGVRLWKSIIGTSTSLDDVTYQLLASEIGEREWPSAKTANNYLVSLRGIMEFIYHGQRAAENPMLGIRNLKVVRKRPDPLSADERDDILKDMESHYDPRVPSYFTFAFYTGMRPEEIIALQWGDIDERRGLVHVERVRTFKGSEREGSKTHSVRDVDLFDEAAKALRIMKPLTKMKSLYVFENPVTLRPWHDDASQRDHYWTPTLKRLKIRHRRAYATRHTFATVALMGGVNPAYVSNQMGHASTKMFFETYSRWIDAADKGVNRKAMAAALSGGEISGEESEVSRAR